MLTYLLAALVFIAAAAALSLGAIFRGKPLRGSCGGLSALAARPGQSRSGHPRAAQSGAAQFPPCELCGGAPAQCLDSAAPADYPQPR